MEPMQQTVTITHGQMTVIATVAVIVAALVTSVSLAVSIISHDRTIQQSQKIEAMDVRVMTLEAYQHSQRNKERNDGSGSL
jgi:hypothetical protein